MYGIKTRGLPGTLAPMYQALQVERSEPPATSRTQKCDAVAANGIPEHQQATKLPQPRLAKGNLSDHDARTRLSRHMC